MVAGRHNSPEIHSAVISAIVASAERQAEMVAACLDLLDQRLKHDGVRAGVNALPPGFLLELGALCQLKFWEEEGLRDFLPPDLPTSTKAARQLNLRTTAAPQQFDQCDTSDRLGACVLQVWLEKFAWDAPRLLQADAILGDIDEDALVDAVAQLLWDLRHDLVG